MLIQDNTAEFTRSGDTPSQGEGGGLALMGGQFTILNSLVLDNQARDGGGICNTNSGLVSHTTLARNIASAVPISYSNGSGGGIYNRGDIELINVTLSANQGQLQGAAAYLPAGTAHFIQVTIANHTTPGGGSLGGMKLDGGRLFLTMQWHPTGLPAVYSAVTW